MGSIRFHLGWESGEQGLSLSSDGGSGQVGGTGREGLGRRVEASLGRRYGSNRVRTWVRQVRHFSQAWSLKSCPKVQYQDKSYFNIITDFSFYARLQYGPALLVILAF